MELDLFRAFLTVAELRSFRRAAGVLHVTQPTLSRQIARLEEELGTQLFERYGRHVECSVNGEFLLPLAQSVIVHADATIGLMRERAGARFSVVRFGATGTVFAHFLNPILTALLPDIRICGIDLREGEDARLEEDVISGELDCAVMTSWGSSRLQLSICSQKR